MEGLESGRGLVLVVLMMVVGRRIITSILAVDLFLRAIVVVEDTLETHPVLGLLCAGGVDSETIIDGGIKVPGIRIEGKRVAGHGGRRGEVCGFV